MKSIDEIEEKLEQVEKTLDNWKKSSPEEKKEFNTHISNLMTQRDILLWVLE